MKDDFIKFTDETIQEVFGHEAAEDEDVLRLKNYYCLVKIKCSGIATATYIWHLPL